MDETTNPTPDPTPTPDPEAPRQDPRTAARNLLREWGFDVDQFQIRAKKSLDAARGDLSEVTGTLRQALSDTKQVLVDLQRTKGPVATELKGGFERAWDEIERAFTRARERMREQPPTAEKAEPAEPDVVVAELM